MKVELTRWSMRKEERVPVAIEPNRVDVVEWFSDPWTGGDGKRNPALSRIIMQGKQEYTVEGSVREVTAKLNGGAS